MTPSDRLVYMANQIARNLAAQGEQTATLMVADHIASFWDPRMKAQIFAMQAPALDPIAAKAIAMLRTGGSPQHQTPATESGGSDAG